MEALATVPSANSTWRCRRLASLSAFPDLFVTGYLKLMHLSHFLFKGTNSTVSWVEEHMLTVTKPCFFFFFLSPPSGCIRRLCGRAGPDLRQPDGGVSRAGLQVLQLRRHCEEIGEHSVSGAPHPSARLCHSAQVSRRQWTQCWLTTLMWMYHWEPCDEGSRLCL